MRKFGTITNKNNLDNKLSKIDIVIGGDYGQGNFCSVGNFIMRDKEGYNKDSYVLKHFNVQLQHQSTIT